MVKANGKRTGKDDKKKTAGKAGNEMERWKNIL